MLRRKASTASWAISTASSVNSSKNSSVRRQVKVDKKGEKGKRQFSNRTGDPVVSPKSPWLCPIQPKKPLLTIPKGLKHLPLSANRLYLLLKIFNRTPARDRPDGSILLKKRLARATPRIVLEGLQGEQSVAEICRREGLNTNIYYRWIGPPKRQGVS